MSSLVLFSKFEQLTLFPNFNMKKKQIRIDLKIKWPPISVVLFIHLQLNHKFQTKALENRKNYKK